MALELNKTSNTYNVFYKDNTNPTQVLGLGTVCLQSRRRIRSLFDQQLLSAKATPIIRSCRRLKCLSVDRIALNDTNPFTDLITLDVDRGIGANDAAKHVGRGSHRAAVVFDHLRLPVRSIRPNGRRSPATTIAQGTGTVDNAPWAVTSSTKTLLSEAFQSGDGGGLTNNQNVVLSLAPRRPGPGSAARSKTCRWC